MSCSKLSDGSQIDVRNLDDDQLIETYLLLRCYANYLNRKGNIDYENTTINSGIRLPDAKRKSDELEEAVKKNFDTLNKISRQINMNIDEEEFKKAEIFFQKKKRLEEMKADPILHTLSGISDVGTATVDYIQCLEELTKVKEELKQEQERGMLLRQQVDSLRSFNQQT